MSRWHHEDCRASAFHVEDALPCHRWTECALIWEADKIIWTVEDVTHILAEECGTFLFFS